MVLFEKDVRVGLGKAQLDWVSLGSLNYLDFVELESEQIEK